MTSRRAAPALLSLAVLLAACGSSATPAPPTTTISASPPTTIEPPGRVDLLARVDELAAENGFSCHMGDTTVSFFPHNGPEPGLDSYYAAMLEPGNGLEIVTFDGVSFARWQGPLPDDASQPRRDVAKKLNGAWGTWKQPDTITLEELPSSPSRCLDWVAPMTFSDVTLQGDGSWAFIATTNTDDPEQVTGSAALDKGVNSSFTVENTELTLLDVSFIRPGDFPPATAGKDGSRHPVGPVVEITQDEYFALVGS